MTRLSTTPLSVLDLAPIRDGGTIADSFSDSVALARLTESLGFTRYWLAEHHSLEGIASAATSVLMGHIAGKTSRIRIGSGGIMLPNHPPLVIAEQFGTLETLYPGRIDLGLGRAPGSDAATMAAMRRDPHAGVDDFPQRLEELEGYLDEARPGQRVQAVPGQGTRVPIWLLGSSLYSAQLAAHKGLPFAFAAQFAPAQLDDALAVYRRNFQPSAVLEAPYAMVGLPVLAADSDEHAHFLSTTAQQKFLGLIRGQRGRAKPPVRSLDWNPMERAQVESFLGAAVIGSPSTVRDGLERMLERTQADELMLNTDTYALEDRLNSYQLVSDVWRQA
ncbi:LLM class flavin-dependent oxidoreductase [Halomonas denitrificans]|uniref:LLM class flavin-dependent oxidoreductase n=1 Tax=Halomonas TaxID=2745 RepID=UPI001C94D0F6|nr:MULTISPECIES: LLM class flavin-dependent oxidoreductase [Halomonas]MBY5929415.1 LLM class flavin-dependent oxidoreductase [Halomonas sp. DP8Y7-3]MBY5968807.1 LLM class flavin-dependent oxidoreductase [Halomonas denitrificans]MBY6207356.1 LLM class flavin-dependent oxidoreductase [Halomonas sp. DP3Y7-2]MBY6228165.1 LLM class flavin-dependent oxidoreductase [Halomonas sp. DP3Y7-1]MCA0916231.1 LLM class flavin-dependent oxidoreductase [Halomonas denitrificans]